MSGHRITSRLDIKGPPSSAESCVAELEATKLLAAIRPAVVAMILGQRVERPSVELVGPGEHPRVLQLLVTRLMLP